MPAHAVFFCAKLLAQLLAHAAHAVVAGGGVYVAADCVLTADTSDFNANTAVSGGAIPNSGCLHPCWRTTDMTRRASRQVALRSQQAARRH